MEQLYNIVVVLSGGKEFRKYRKLSARDLVKIQGVLNRDGVAWHHINVYRRIANSKKTEYFKQIRK